VEIERLKETHFDGSRSGKNFALDRQIEPVVMESEISGLPDLHAFLKYGNYVTGFSFPYLDVLPVAVPFIPRETAQPAPPPMRPKKPRVKEPEPWADRSIPLEPPEQLEMGG
jgi:hypothetical protein